MAAPETRRVDKLALTFRFGTESLRKVIAPPPNWRKPEEPRRAKVFNACAANDPMTALVDGDILPRIMMAHVVDGSLRPLEERIEIDAEETKSFVPLPLRLEAPGLLEEVDRFLAQGASVEEVYLDLLAPAAHYLGELWARDECDFVDVTMGLWRLQEVMREITLRSPPDAPRIGTARSALFCPVPGDVHSFGAQMIEEVFARAGWQSEVLLKPERRELLDYVAKNPVNLVGLTVSTNAPVSALAGLVKAIRSVAANPKLCVLIGGHMINQNPELAEEIGADGTGSDARAALETANSLVPTASLRARAAI